jgi:hypothetical protein
VRSQSTLQTPTLRINLNEHPLQHIIFLGLTTNYVPWFKKMTFKITEKSHLIMYMYLAIREYLV